ncbi:hypothetical protein [Streptomyces sp. S1D4-14]|nr:hypothetical protein [Streptomyces sp. S1D4-14]
MTETTPEPCSRCTWEQSRTKCRICRKDFCSGCWTDHHHEGYGTPAADER